MFLESKHIHLRRTTNKDLDFVCSLESDKENIKYIIPWTREKHESSLKNKDIMHLLIEEKIGGTPVGYIIIAGLLNIHKSIEIVRITISEKGKGFGKEALKMIKHWAFITFEANRLWLDVKVHNDRALNLYKNQGFMIEGTLRECIKNENGYESLHVMSILRREYVIVNKHYFS